MKTYSAAGPSVRVRKSRAQAKAFVSALLGREVSYIEALKVKRDLADVGILPVEGRARTKPNAPLRPQSLSSKAREAGLSMGTVYTRIIRLGWSEERALSTPSGVRTRDHPNSIAYMARAVGQSPDRVRRRIRDGMALEEALTAPIMTCSDSATFGNFKRNGKNPRWPDSQTHSKLDAVNSQPLPGSIPTADVARDEVIPCGPSTATPRTKNV